MGISENSNHPTLSCLRQGMPVSPRNSSLLILIPWALPLICAMCLLFQYRALFPQGSFALHHPTLNLYFLPFSFYSLQKRKTKQIKKNNESQEAGSTMETAGTIRYLSSRSSSLMEAHISKWVIMTLARTLKKGCTLPWQNVTGAWFSLKNSREVSPRKGHLEMNSVVGLEPREKTKRDPRVRFWCLRPTGTTLMMRTTSTKDSTMWELSRAAVQSVVGDTWQEQQGQTCGLLLGKQLRKCRQQL